MIYAVIIPILIPPSRAESERTPATIRLMLRKATAIKNPMPHFLVMSLSYLDGIDQLPNALQYCKAFYFQRKWVARDISLLPCLSAIPRDFQLLCPMITHEKLPSSRAKVNIENVRSLLCNAINSPLGYMCSSR